MPKEDRWMLLESIETKIKAIHRFRTMQSFSQTSHTNDELEAYMNLKNRFNCKPTDTYLPLRQRIAMLERMQIENKEKIKELATNPESEKAKFIKYSIH